MLSMDAKIHKMPEVDLWGGQERLSSSLKVKKLQQETYLKAALTILGVISLNPQEIVDDLAKRREIIEDLQNSTNNQIMQHIQEQQWGANIIPLDLEWPQEYRNVA